MQRIGSQSSPAMGSAKRLSLQGLRVLETAASAFDFALDAGTVRLRERRLLHQHRCDAARRLVRDSEPLRRDLLRRGGWPEVVPDHVSLWGSLLQFRREFDQYVNLRPVRLVARRARARWPAARRATSTSSSSARTPKASTSSIGGNIFEGTDRETVVQETVMTRTGVDRILRYAFELAQADRKQHLTSATKSNGISITMPYWDERVAAMAKRVSRRARRQVPHRHPDRELRPPPRLVRRRRRQQPLRRHPLRPRPGVHRHHRHRAERPTSTRSATFPSLFEPVHGSAPDIAGKGIANPIGQIWSGEHDARPPRRKGAAAAIMTAVEDVLTRGGDALTPDMGGTATTTSLGEEVNRQLRANTAIVRG